MFRLSSRPDCSTSGIREACHEWFSGLPLLASPPRRCGGRVCIDDHARLAGIIDQLRTGMAVRAG
jgi:hypothetical protein